MSFMLKFTGSDGRAGTWPPLPDKMAALKQARSLVRQKCALVSLTRPDGSVIGQEALAKLIATLPPD
jgi:hypothetical protein